MAQNVFFDGVSWQSFRELENNVIDCFRYVACVDEHGCVWSNRFGELLIRIGSAVDSFFFEARNCYLFDNEEGMNELRGKKEPNIEDYRKFFEHYYNLSGASVGIYPNGVFYKDIFPFGEFSSNKRLEWWNAYNKVKHEWYNCLKNYGTLRNMLYALGGLFIINVLHKDSQKWLVQKGIIEASRNRTMGRYTITNSITSDEITSALKQSRTGISKTLNAQVTSRLFKHEFRQE